MSKLTDTRNFFRGKLGMNPIGGEKESDSATPDDDTSAMRNEHSMLVILKEARRRFMERELIGSVDISMSVGIFTSSISCDIPAATETVTGDEETTRKSTGDDDNVASTVEEKEKLKTMEKIVLSYLDGVLKLLEKRASAYKTLPFSDDVSLTNGVYISDPIFGSVSFAISLTATVASILSHQLKK